MRWVGGSTSLGLFPPLFFSRGGFFYDLDILKVHAYARSPPFNQARCFCVDAWNSRRSSTCWRLVPVDTRSIPVPRYGHVFPVIEEIGADCAHLSGCWDSQAGFTQKLKLAANTKDWNSNIIREKIHSTSRAILAQLLLIHFSKQPSVMGHTCSVFWPNFKMSSQL